ncbi:MAG: hypothetical protein JW737_08295 [Acidobacteria bacterium]|nr:hypothetical protein [Acidobacteriota bacterium]
MSGKYLFTFCLIGLLLSFGCSKSIETETYASNLGKVYGITFDNAGILYAVGTKGEANVIWKVQPGSEPQVFTTLSDEGDVLAPLGLSNHSQNMAQLTFDSKGKLWVASTRHAGSFAITPDGKATKVYLNTNMSVSIQEGMEYPNGCMFDPASNKIFIITSGPKGGYDYTNVHKVSAITPSDSSLCEELKMIKDTGYHDVATIPNKGIKWEGPARGIMTAADSKVYVIAKDALYEVKSNNSLEKADINFGDVSLWAGISDDKGNMYFSVNNNEFTPADPGKDKGYILKVTPDKNVSVLVQDIGQPLGLAYRDKALYIADRLSGGIIKVNLPN